VHPLPGFVRAYGPGNEKEEAAWESVGLCLEFIPDAVPKLQFLKQPHLTKGFLTGLFICGTRL
jgi:hypothetical protein